MFQESAPIPQDETLVEVDQSRDKIHYFGWFFMHYLGRETRLLKSGGVLRPAEGAENWRQVSKHCLSEAVGADILAEALGADRDMVRKAALIHDWYKRREIERKREHGFIDGFRMADEEDHRLLREYGIPEELIKLAHANRPESADLEYLANRSLEEKIVQFLDLMTEQDDWVSYQRRNKSTRVTSPQAKEWSESFRPEYGGVSLFELNKICERMEREEFEQKLELEPGTITNWMRQKLNERIETFKKKGDQADQLQ